MSRLPRSRWTRIGAWTGAALAWGTTVAMNQERAAEAAAESESAAPLPTVNRAPLPALPDGGLVILRYRPIPVPDQLVITRHVTVALAAGTGPAANTGGGGVVTGPGGGSSTSSSAGGTGGGGGSALAPPPPPPPPPTMTTTAPNPTSGGS